MAAVGTIETLLRDIRRWINDRNVNPTYDNSELLRNAAGAYDRVVEDVFTVTQDKPYVQFDLPLVANQTEYLLPSGIGHVHEISVLSTMIAGTVERIVDAIVPAYNQTDIRWPGWLWNPPILKFSSAPTSDMTVRITFLPRAIDYMHEGLVGNTAIRQPGYGNVFTLTVTGSTGTYSLWWCGVTIADIPTDTTVEGLQDLIAAAEEESELLTAASIVVSGSVGAFVLTFAAGYYPSPVVFNDTTDGTTIVVTGTDDYPEVEDTTFVLDTTPVTGDFDPRPNAYIGGRLRVLSAGTPYGYTGFRWQERDIIEYDPATATLTLSSPFDFPVYSAAGATDIEYEVMSFFESTLLKACAIETARHIQAMNGNVQRSAVLGNEYAVALVTARRMVANRNQALPMMPTPTRYLRDRQLSGTDGYINTTVATGLDRFSVV